MEQKEFTIEGRKETFRVGKMNAVELLALNMQLDFNDLRKTETTLTFVYEHLEVSLEGKWLPVKEKGRDLYWPADIAEDFHAMNALFVYFIKEVLTPLFTKSSE